MSSKIVLVTGAAGFIGSQICLNLLKDGLTVWGIDNFNDYYDPRLKEFRIGNLKAFEKFQFVTLDVENKPDLVSFFSNKQFDVIYNLAARAGVRASVESPDVYLTTNINGTLNLLEQIKHGQTKFILASTSSLYAGQKMPFSEELSVNTPISPYAASKKAAEQLAYTYHYLYGIDISILRYFTVYGPAGRPDMSVFRFIKWIDSGQPIVLFGDGAHSRDFTFVDDIAKGTILASKKLGYEIINLGGGNKPMSMSKLISVIEEKIGKKAMVDFKDASSADAIETWANIEKAKKLLNWKPEVSVEAGIEACIDWYYENRDFVNSLKI